MVILYALLKTQLFVLHALSAKCWVDLCVHRRKLRRQLTAVLPPSFGRVSASNTTSIPETPGSAAQAVGSSGVLLDVAVHRITPLKALSGRLVLTASTLLFLPSPDSVGADENGWFTAESSQRDFYWMWFLSELTSLRLKRFYAEHETERWLRKIDLLG